MSLTDTFIKATKPLDRPAKISDGGGLHLLVSTTGSKLWRLAYRYDGKQKALALGIYPVCSLSVARTKREAAKKLLADGIDPAEHARLQKMADRSKSGNSFETIASEMLVKSEKEGRAPATLNKNRWLISLALPDIGKRPVDQITAVEILASLRKVEAKGNYETARRQRAIIGQVFRYAIATARVENDPTFGLRGALINPTVINRPAVTKPKEVANLMRAVWAYEGTPEVRAPYNSWLCSIQGPENFAMRTGMNLILIQAFGPYRQNEPKCVVNTASLCQKLPLIFCTSYRN